MAVIGDRWHNKKSAQQRGEEGCYRAQGCGATGIRTPDLLHAMQALYQLSYGPVS